ncbi:carboxymuconolactone decarboxylase family protein [Chryseobacterium koreense]
MKTNNIIFSWSIRIFIPLMLLLVPSQSNAQNSMEATKKLDAAQQSMASISALTAVGNIDSLTVQLHKGLDAGLTINEIKETLVHLYAYVGFPRSLNGLTAFMQVVEDRKKAGKQDVEGRNASALSANTNMLELGTEVQTKLVGQPVSGGVMAFAPAIDRYLKEHLFGAIFASDVLSYQQRELVTVSALAAMQGTGGQLQGHLKYAMNTGLTKSQLEGILDVIEKHISKEQADKGRAILSKL